jgi:hypothetical protein
VLCERVLKVCLSSGQRLQPGFGQRGPSGVKLVIRLGICHTECLSRFVFFKRAVSLGHFLESDLKVDPNFVVCFLSPFSGKSLG